MITWIEIVNFRGIKHLRVEGLRNVNLFVGPNGSGKSSILEAVLLWLSQGNPVPLVSLQGHRGARGYRDLDPATRALFNGFETYGECVISAVGNESAPLDLRITRSMEHEIPIRVLEESNVLGAAMSQFPVIFHWTDREKDAMLIWDEQDGAPKAIGARRSKDTSAMMHPTGTAASVELSNRFSELLKKKKKSSLIKALNLIDPGVQNIEWLADEEYFGVDLGDRTKNTLVPIGALGSGMNRVLSLIVTCVASGGSALLVDEIDTGLHFSNMSKMLRVLIDTASDVETQLFFTTHSIDAIRALFEAVDEKKLDRVALFRTTYDKSSGVGVSRLSGKEAAQLVEGAGIEIR